MHKIDGAGHLNNTFVQEDVSTSQPPTEMTDEWLNAVQSEIVNVIEAAGISLNKSQNNQLLQALRASGLFQTPAQFDNTTKAATTTFVQRALGSFSNLGGISVATTLNSGDVGKIIYLSSGGYDVFLPLANTVIAGGAINLYAYSTSTINLKIQGTNVIHTGNINTNTSVPIEIGCTATFISDGTSGWYLVEGSASQQYANLFASKTQSWQNVAASRAVNTTYTNSTGRAIAIQCGCTATGATGYYTIQVNGIQVAFSNVTAGQAFSLYAIVPAGGTYIFSKGGGDTLTTLTWNELR